MKPKKTKSKKKSQSPLLYGIRLPHKDGQPHSFEMYFNFLMPELSECMWLVGWDCFEFPWMDWDETQEAQIESQRILVGQYYLVDTNFVRQYMGYINSFWNTLYCFSNTQVDWEQWNKLRFSTGGEEVDFLLDTTHIVFFSIDGAFWEVLTRQEDILHRLFERYSSAIPVKK